MKIKHILIFCVVVALSSCSTAYRSAQTPDDVYYSPAPEQNSYVNSVNDPERNSYGYHNEEEQQIRQGIQNPIYRTPISVDLGYSMGYSPYGYDPYGFNSGLFYSGYGYNSYGYNGLYSPYGYSPYGYGYGGGLSFYSNLYSPFSLYSPYSYYNSPYYGGLYGYSPYYNYGKGTFNTNQGARRYNLTPYHRPVSTSGTGSVGIRNNIETTRPANSAPVRRTTGVGNVIRRVFTPSQSRSTYQNNNSGRNNGRTYNNQSNNRYNNQRAPTRNFSNPPSVNTPSPSESRSSNNSAPVRTFRR